MVELFYDCTGTAKQSTFLNVNDELFSSVLTTDDSIRLFFKCVNFFNELIYCLMVHSTVCIL